MEIEENSLYWIHFYVGLEGRAALVDVVYHQERDSFLCNSAVFERFIIGVETHISE
jgi:hypothetical protein